MLRLVRRLAWVLAAMLLWSAHGHAQQPSPNDVTLAREQFRSGVEMANGGRWEDAHEAFLRAYRLYPQPAVLLNLASAQVRTGRLVAGAESYRKLLRAPGDLSADQQAAARSALESVEKRVAHVRIRVEGALAADRVELDGAPVPAAALDADLPVDPGRHELRVVREGAEAARAHVELGEAEARSVTLRPKSRPASTPDSRPRGGVLASPWFWTAVGVVVLGGTAALVCVATCAKEPYAGSLGTVKLP